MKSLVAPRPAKIQQSKDDGRARTKPQHRRRLRPRLDRDGRSVGHRLRHGGNRRGRTLPRPSMRLLALLPIRD
jgi:hypothetical protein